MLQSRTVHNGLHFWTGHSFSSLPRGGFTSTVWEYWYGFLIAHLIKIVDNHLLTLVRIIAGISALSGFLYGLICLLVPYVGFFTLGFHSGLLLGLSAMILFPAGHSIWISIIFLLGNFINH